MTPASQRCNKIGLPVEGLMTMTLFEKHKMYYLHAQVFPQYTTVVSV